MSTKEITFEEKKVYDILNEVEQAYFEIPFGNTRFQQEVFVVAAAITPPRAYRIIGLQLQSILATLKERLHKYKLRAIEIEELEENLQDENLNKFEKRKLELKLEEHFINENWEKKLLNDALEEANFYYSKFKSFPKYTREQFESGEQLYFEQTLSRQLLGLAGAKESIINMLDDSQTIKNFENAVASLPPEKLQEMLMELSTNLSSKVQPADENGNPIFRIGK